jgi:hypothetical protein
VLQRFSTWLSASEDRPFWVFGGLLSVGLLALRTAREARVTPAQSGYSFGGPPLRAGVDREPANLLPAFAAKVEKLFQAMRARGFEPLLWEGLRTPARAAKLAAGGTGSENSLHVLGGAVDVVDGSTAPNYWTGAPGFWGALGVEAERLGLTWGGRRTRVDLVHVQAVPVAQQTAFRAASPAERNRMV